VSLEYRNRSSGEMPGTPGSVPGPGIGISGIPSGPPGTSVWGQSQAGDVNGWVRMPLAVGASDVNDVALTLRRGSTMRGRIAWDGAGHPPSPTAITAEPADGSTWLGMPRSVARASFDDDPGFTINGFLPGEYVLRVIGLAPPYAVKSIMINGRDYASLPIDATSGRDFDDVVVTYTDRIATITGTVTAEAGAPPASVIAFPVERDQWTRYGFSAPRFRTAGVSNSGRYKIENLPAGRYFVIAIDSEQASRWQDPAFLAEAAKGAATVTVGWGETGSQDLKLSVIK
jgi:hypothetical protein